MLLSSTLHNYAQKTKINQNKKRRNDKCGHTNLKKIVIIPKKYAKQMILINKRMKI
jgi:hypothetical protein